MKTLEKAYPTYVHELQPWMIGHHVTFYYIGKSSPYTFRGGILKAIYTDHITVEMTEQTPRFKSYEKNRIGTKGAICIH